MSNIAMKTFKIALLSLGLFLTVVSVYYFVMVLNARAETPTIVADALRSANVQLELDDLTKQQRDALIKIQDPNFYGHRGFDFTTPGAGVTSLSQGLVKIFYFEKFKPGLPKIKQTLIARFAFDALTPKDTILKLFVNHVYLGQRDGEAIHGFENAADFYFKKNFQDLSQDEYLALVAMIRAPLVFHYFNQRESNNARVARIKKYLAGEYVPQDNSDWLYDREQ